MNLARTNLVLILALTAFSHPLPAQDVPRGFELVDGDMIVPEGALLGEGYFTGNMWTGGIVPYLFDAGVTPTQQAAMLLAMAEWEAVAAVDFVSRTTQGNYLRIRQASTAGVSSAAVGMNGGSQNVNICCWTNRHHMAHELGHALGLTHEHQRPDRDAWITIVPANIASSSSQFPITGGGTTATPYDYGSLMHYGQFTFSVCGGSGPPCGPGFETILVDPPATTFWQSRIGHQAYVSTADAQGMAGRYGPPLPPSITSITPSSIPEGSGNTLVTVDGSGFLQGSQNPWGMTIGVQGTHLKWGGLSLLASVQSPTRLTAVIPSNFPSSPGCVTIRVENPVPGGSVSSTSVAFTIENVSGSGSDWRGAFPGENYGSAVAHLGATVSGERAAILVGAPGYEPDQRGRAQLRRGSSGGILREWTGTVPRGRFGHAVAGIGDVTGDGYEDVAVGAPGAGSGIAYFYDGRTGAQLRVIVGIGGPGTEFGFALANAGDLNADGLPDVAVSTPGYGGGQGLVEVFSGASFAPGAGLAVLRTLFGPASGSRFGAALAGNVDVNGDGTPDLVVGAPLDDSTAAADAGSVSAISGATSAVLWRNSGPAAGDHLGSCVAGLGDVTGDGRAEVLAGAPDRDVNGAASGALFVYTGGSGSLLQTLLGAAAGDRFGCAAASAGDIDDDGIADVVAGAWSADAGGTDAGAAVVVSGRTWAVLRRIDGDEAGARLGWSVAGLDDRNKDGARELLAGSPWSDGLGGCPDAGRVRAFPSLSLWCARELEPALGAEVRAHVDGCPSCRGLVAELEADEELARKIGHRTAASAPDGGPATLLPASVAGYRIVREIQRGGQGVVFEAVQESTNRRVALKLLLSGPRASARERFRFEREIELAARLRHPHIVTIHDAGVSADGWPYLAMELVDGRPLCAEAEGGARDPRAVLRLFVRICDAVHFAHLRGVLHRDLKPSNILVDSRGEPRILDFGVAKPVEAGAPVLETLGTAQGEFVGTLAYAAPEQLRAEPGGVDVRTDVHALGVILYELLTGSLPYDVHGPLPRVVRELLDAEPRRPSAVRPGFDRDLEAVLLQALAKEKERRYQSAGDLARDVERWLSGQPVAARSGSRWYVLRRALARHWLAASAAGLVFVTLTAATAVSLAFWRNAEREGVRATAEWGRAEAARKAAEHDARRLGATNHFWRRLLEAAGGGPEGERAKLSDLVAEGERLLGPLAAEEPSLRAAFHDALGSCCRSLGRVADAERHYAAALELIRADAGPAARDTLLAMVNLATAQIDLGRTSEAEVLLREAVAGLREVEGEGGVALLVAASHLAQILRDRGASGEAADLLERSLGARDQRSGDPEARRREAMARSLLGLALADLGRLEEAEGEARRAVDDVSRAGAAGGLEASNCRARLGTVLLFRGRLEEAKAALAVALDGFRAATRPGTAVRLETQANLAACLVRLGRLDEAAQLYNDALGTESEDPAGDPPPVLAVRAAAAWLDGLLDPSGDAVSRLRRILRAQRETPGVRPLDLVTSMRCLGGLLVEAGRPEEAEPLARSALDLARGHLGDSHPDVLELRGDLGRCWKELGRLEDAVRELREALSEQERVLGEGDPRTLRTANDLAFVLMEQGRSADAEPLLSRAMRAAGNSLPEGHLHRALYRRNYGLCLHRLGRPADAAPHLIAAFEALESSPAASPHLVRSTLDLVVEVHEALGLPEDATRWRRRQRP